MNRKMPVLLSIIDGWGISPDKKDNAISLAKTPNFDFLKANFPSATLKAHGLNVGLPKDQMGNSEVGHTTIGSGRINLMNLPKIDGAIANGNLNKNECLKKFMLKIKKTGGAVHLAGIVSDGGVHGHHQHIIELAKLFAGESLKVNIHAFLDGRDVSPRSASKYLSILTKELPKEAKICTLIGRFYSMDRDNRWERTEKAHFAIMDGVGQEFLDPDEAIKEAYLGGQSDEFITPRIISGYQGVVSMTDGLFFTNFRSDRAREILYSFLYPDFKNFNRSKTEFAVACGLVDYCKTLETYMGSLFPSDRIINCLGQLLEDNGKKQFRIAETEKYPHVTFFFNSGNESAYTGEDRCLVPSPKVETYDLAPEMSAHEVKRKLILALREGAYDFLVVNFANPDMVGHTGDLASTIKACETVDSCLGEILETLQEISGTMLLISDHGNSEQMFDRVNKTPHTAHTKNNVPVILVGYEKEVILAEGGLSDVAPTILDIMGILKPEEMTGKSLIIQRR